MGVVGISRTSATRIITTLTSEPLNLIEYQGSKKNGGYVLTEKGKVFIKTLHNNAD